MTDGLILKTVCLVSLLDGTLFMDGFAWFQQRADSTLIHIL